jgi:hypothetical protein
MTALIISTWAGRPVNLGDLFAPIPDDVVLSVATRDLDLGEADRCLCGWVLREQLARAAGVDASEQTVDSFRVVGGCVEAFGGDYDAWSAVFRGVTNYRARIIEEAWTNRVLDALEIADAPPIVYNTRRPQLVLPADVYDTLELSAFAHGGIGADSYNTGNDSATEYVDDEGGLLGRFGRPADGAESPALGAPVCAVGHAAFAAIPRRFGWYNLINGNTIDENDEAVMHINKRKGKTGAEVYNRVTFEEWVSELNIRRGDV